MERNHHLSLRGLLKPRIPAPPDVTVKYTTVYEMGGHNHLIHATFSFALLCLFLGHISVIVPECKHSHMSPFISILMEPLKRSASPINSRRASQAAAAAVYLSCALPFPHSSFPLASYVANSDTEIRPPEFRRP